MEAGNCEKSRERSTVTEHQIENTAYSKYPGNYYGHSDEWNELEFRNEFKAEIVDYVKGRSLEIDLIGVGPAIVNAYRRIMIAEVPSMAIELCFIYNNTSVLQDEMLSHRLGLIPLKVNHKLFLWRDSKDKSHHINPQNTIGFTLRAKCKKKATQEAEKSSRREDIYNDYKVFSSHIKYIPVAAQLAMIQPMTAIAPVHKNILIAKLSAKQEIDLVMHAVKGIGRDHTKFSPVATASYRLMPEIKLLEPIRGSLAEKLKESFSEGVVNLRGSKKEAFIANSRIDSGSRNVFRHPELKDKVSYDLIKDHYIFKVESSGCVPAIDILLESCDILGGKCEYFLNELKLYRSGINKSAAVVEGV